MDFGGKKMALLIIIHIEVFDRLEELFRKKIITLDAPGKAGGGVDWPSYNFAPMIFVVTFLSDKINQNNP